jgi:hypothetical protein
MSVTSAKTAKHFRRTMVTWHGFQAELLHTLEYWQPSAQRTERAYRDDLVRFLREQLPTARVEREWRHNGTTADVFVRWMGLVQTHDTYFELKRNLTSKPEFNRLVGQVDDLDPTQHRVFIVVCGRSDERFVSRLREKYARVSCDGWDSTCVVLEK